MEQTTDRHLHPVAGIHHRREGLAGFETAALNILRRLVDAGMAGLDCYDHSSFIVDLPFGEQRDSAEIALDCLGAIHHTEGSRFRCELPGFARDELGLNTPGARELLMPLASRKVDIGEIARDLVSPAAMHTAKAAYDRRYPEGQVH